ncbi:PqqD family protein [Rubellicoccus peritrichatus]|uniref:PqqD family protein n=1 Tax=Rubellicoccus peritrichatus TaxID=3080537 RepID=A0AAQ3LC51_9BACT|nr:PqqD family protein [Puniceicoccus sp. CR14]WOO42686.1 PqqD family protein [Puniceicoccus sp. CR14]
MLFEYYQKRSSEIVSEAIDGEAVVIDLNNGAYYSLEGAGLYVWEALVAGYSVSDITQKLEATFAESSANIGPKVEAMVTSLLESELLVGRDSASVTEPSSTTIPLPENLNSFEIQCYSDMKDLLMLDPIHEVDEQGWPQKADHADKV